MEIVFRRAWSKQKLMALFLKWKVQIRFAVNHTLKIYMPMVKMGILVDHSSQMKGEAWV